jgi:hypothetical protein
MSWIRRCAVAATLCAGLVVPAAASAHSSLATVRHDVNAAGSALHALQHAGAHHPSAAKRALGRNQASMVAGARAVHSLAQSGNVRATASALGLLAKQYNRNVRTYVSLIPTSSGSLQSQLASSLQPALEGRTLSSWLLGQLTTVLPAGGDTSAATGTLTGLLGNLPSLIQSLTGVVGGGDVSSQIQTIVAQALTTATGVLDASLAQVQALLPSLPAADQATIQTVLSQIQSIVGTIQSTLANALQSITGSMGGTTTGSTLTSTLPQVLGLLQNLLAGIAGSGSTGTGSTATGSGSTGTGSTGSGSPDGGTCSAGVGSLFGNLPIPSFLSGLLQNLGLGQLSPGCSPSGSGSGIAGMFGGLPFGF